ncbi:type II toxin-antitoxin system HipA family toxin [Gemmatimonadota bacterium]
MLNNKVIRYGGIMLKVYFHDRDVGRLQQDDRGFLTFEYNDQALDDPESSAISVRLPVRPESYEDRECRPYFENLLPESSIRDLISAAKKIDTSDTIRLLGAIGGECAGAVSVWPEGSSPEHPPQYEKCSREYIAALFEIPRGEDIISVHLRTRQSLSGAQEKLVLRRDSDEYFLPLRGAASNVILKRPKEQFPGLVQNELVCMSLMERAGLPVAGSNVSSAWSGLFESQRYDRIVQDDGSINRLHQEDFCQLVGKGAARKYQESGGPDVNEIRIIIERHSSLAIEDVEYLLRWTIVNLCIGNNDAHAKNLSMLYTREGLRLSPTYDAVSTVVYPFIDSTLAIYFGGQSRFEAIDASAFRTFARSLGYPKPTFPLAITEEVIDALLSSIDEVCHNIAQAAGHHAIIEEIARQVRERSNRLREAVV